MPFDAIADPLRRALTDRGYLEPTPVQAAVLEAGALGRDLLVSAQTGSGKTVGFGLAIAAHLLEPARPGPPIALVVAPTRELAMQVQRELSWLFAHVRLAITACVGGMDPRREARELRAGSHVVVGTPGRLCDHLERGQLDLSKLRALVLDEADEMLDLGFRDEMEKLLAATPAERQTLMFSATLPKPIVALAKQYQRDAVRVATALENEPHGDITYFAMPIAPHDREHAVVNLLRWFDTSGALVFCATREGVKHLHGSLVERGFPVVALSGELSQPERTRALQTLRDGRATACVATDVAARGLDLPDLGLVIHADLPQGPHALLHRSGRTGRAGRKGTCAVLVPAPRRAEARDMLERAGVHADWTLPPSADDVRARDQERLVAELAALAEKTEEEGIATARLLLERCSAERLVAELVRLKRGLAPAPEELSPVPPERRYDPSRRAPYPPGRGKPPGRHRRR
jgi:ATP-dependent RNA helicase DeaD